MSSIQSESPPLLLLLILILLLLLNAAKHSTGDAVIFVGPHCGEHVSMSALYHQSMGLSVLSQLVGEALEEEEGRKEEGREGYRI